MSLSTDFFLQSCSYISQNGMIRQEKVSCVLYLSHRKLVNVKEKHIISRERQFVVKSASNPIAALETKL